MRDLTVRVPGVEMPLALSIYNRPQVLERVTSEGAWDLDRLAESVEESFRPVLDSAPPRVSLA